MTNKYNKSWLLDYHGLLRTLLTNSVKARIKTDRPFGALLSGGLDSSLVCGILKSLLPTTRFPVFTLALSSGSDDLAYASQVAKELDLDHHVITLDPESLLQDIERTIYAIESFDITTVRASILQYGVSRYIKEHTEIKVILVGELADEVAGGYLYTHLAPSDSEYHEDCARLVQEVHRFDGLRTDRTCAAFGLEVRLPYADKHLVDFYLSIPPAYRRVSFYHNGTLDLATPRLVEKGLLRDAFAKEHLIPTNVLYRKKNAFSDSVSKMENSWYRILQNHIETLVTDEEFHQHKGDYLHCPPFTKESYYYRKIFENYYGKNAEVIPKFWMPQWTEATDPSARTLPIYQKI